MLARLQRLGAKCKVLEHDQIKLCLISKIDPQKTIIRSGGREFGEQEGYESIRRSDETPWLNPELRGLAGAGVERRCRVGRGLSELAEIRADGRLQVDGRV